MFLNWARMLAIQLYKYHMAIGFVLMACSTVSYLVIALDEE